MNRMLISVRESTIDPIVRKNAQFLIENAYSRIAVTFKKMNGEVETAVIVPSNEWNRTNGLKTTKTGLKGVLTKVNRGIINVCGIVSVGGATEIRPLSLNLSAIIEMKVA